MSCLRHWQPGDVRGILGVNRESKNANAKGSSRLTHDSQPDPSAIARFISRWESSGSAERANYTMFLTELCVTAGWDAAMKKAKGQAERYVRSLPPVEGNLNLGGGTALSISDFLGPRV
jgi:hypothetical protein